MFKMMLSFTSVEAPSMSGLPRGSPQSTGRPSLRGSCPGAPQHPRQSEVQFKHCIQLPTKALLDISQVARFTSFLFSSNHKKIHSLIVVYDISELKKKKERKVNIPHWIECSNEFEQHYQSRRTCLLDIVDKVRKVGQKFESQVFVDKRAR